MRECPTRARRGNGERRVRNVRLDRSPAAGAARAALRGSAAAPAGGGRGGVFLLSPGGAPRDTPRDGALAVGVPGRGGPAYAAHSAGAARLPPAAVLAASIAGRDLHARSPERRPARARRGPRRVAVRGRLSRLRSGTHAAHVPGGARRARRGDDQRAADLPWGALSL